jgi:hypothetical protein
MIASTDHPHTGTYDMKQTPVAGTPGSSGKTESLGSYGEGYAYRIWFYDVPTKVTNYAENSYLEDSYANQVYLASQSTNTYYQYLDGGSWVNTAITRTAGFHYFEYKVKSGHVIMVVDGTEVRDSTRLTTTALANVAAYCYRANPNPSWWDDFLIRKWVDPEPAHSTWGTEETEAPAAGQPYISRVQQVQGMHSWIR